MKRLWLASVAVLLAAAPGARADEPFAVTAEGGVGHYTGALGSALQTGGVWAVRGEWFATPWLQTGVAYVGGANMIALGNDSSAVLQRDGGEASVKAVAPFENIRPFVEAGAGLTRFHTRDVDPSLGVHGATAMTIPLGLGVQANAGAVRAGLRLGTELFVGAKPFTGGGGALLNAALTLGARF